MFSTSPSLDFSLRATARLPKSARNAAWARNFPCPGDRQHAPKVGQRSHELSVAARVPSQQKGVSPRVNEYTTLETIFFLVRERESVLRVDCRSVVHARSWCPGVRGTRAGVENFSGARVALGVCFLNFFDS